MVSLSVSWCWGGCIMWCRQEFFGSYWYCGGRGIVRYQACLFGSCILLRDLLINLRREDQDHEVETNSRVIEERENERTTEVFRTKSNREFPKTPW